MSTLIANTHAYVPYLTTPTGLPVPMFGLLVSIGMVVGYFWAVHRGKQYGVARDQINSLVICVVFPAFLGSHVLQVLFYRPQLIPEDPLLLLRFNKGISSFG